MDPVTGADPAGDPLAEVERLVLSGRHSEAQAAARRAQLLYEAKGDRHREALSILLLASAELGLESFYAAANDFARSAAMLEGIGDRLNALLALGELGNLEHLRKRPVEALTRFEQSLGQLRMIAGSSEPFSPLALQRLGFSPDILRKMQSQPEAAKSRILRFAEALSQTGVVGSLLDSGRLEQAEKELVQLTRACSTPLGFSRQRDRDLPRRAAAPTGSARRGAGDFCQAAYRHEVRRGKA